MTLKKVVLSIIAVDFLALTGYVIYLYGPIGWIEPLASNWVGRLVVFDLLIALGIATWWMVRDARATGRNFWPYLALTLTTGSTGPLLYMIMSPSPRRALAEPARRAELAA